MPCSGLPPHAFPRSCVVRTPQLLLFPLAHTLFNKRCRYCTHAKARLLVMTYSTYRPLLADTETNTKYRDYPQPRASEAAGLLNVYVADSGSWSESGEGAVGKGQVVELWKYYTYCPLDVYMCTVMGRSILAERGGFHYCTRPTGIQCRPRHECRRYDDELTWSKLHPPCMHASEEEEVGSWLAD